MSFLNPVNEPVLRFSSTDADAPQIDYAARTAGDVKTVLKACLVTGYGAKTSAGWSVVNETEHVAEFVSPSVAMSDYRLGIDDTSTSSTTWYYQYQNVRTNPASNSPTKSFSYADKSHIDNGWQLFVTNRGVLLLELVQHDRVRKLSARITYLGQIKSALKLDDVNMMFFTVGHNAPTSSPYLFYSSGYDIHANINNHSSVEISSATKAILANKDYHSDQSVVGMICAMYLTTKSPRTLLLGELPPLLSKIVNSRDDYYGISEFALDGRNVLSVTAGYAIHTASWATIDSRAFLIRTDYWEY